MSACSVPTSSLTMNPKASRISKFQPRCRESLGRLALGCDGGSQAFQAAVYMNPSQSLDRFLDGRPWLADRFALRYSSPTH